MTSPTSAITVSDFEIGYANQLTGVWKYLFIGGGAGLGLFALWSAGPGIAEDHFHLAIYTATTWVLALLILPARKSSLWTVPPLSSLILSGITVGSLGLGVLRLDLVAEAGPTVLDIILWPLAAIAIVLAIFKTKAVDLILIGLSVFCIGYFLIEFRELIDRAGAWTTADLGIAGIATLIALEVARRGIGPWIPGIALFAMLYALFGQHFPQALAHRGIGLERVLNYTLYSQEGIFGIMTTVMANFVLIFIFLGAFMNRSGMGQFFIELPLSFAGRSPGGPAKVAVFASAIFGSISGSSLANIVSTGTFTIPLMKRVGFRPHIAGAIENTASLGGQLLPPVMGAGAFVMAEITGVSYATIIGIAAIPALIYLFSIILVVHFEARKYGIQGLPLSEIRSAWTVLREGWFHVVPFIVLLWLLIAGFSPDYCAVMSIASVVVINWGRVAHAKITGGDRPTFVFDLKNILLTLVDGTRNSLIVGGAAACVGIIVGMIALTGLGLKMSLLLIDLSQGNLFFALVLVAITSLIMGMALPITASYLVVVVLAGPALEQLGVPLIAAHMIVFWLSQDSNITPPVCLGAFVAASIAQANPWQTGWASFRFAKMLYVMPALFAFTPILFSGETADVFWTIGSAVIGTIAFSAWTMVYLYRRTTLVEWIVLGIAALASFMPVDLVITEAVSGRILNIAGAVLLAMIYYKQRVQEGQLKVPQ